MVIKRDGHPQHQGLDLKMTLPTHDALPGHLGTHQHRPTVRRCGDESPTSRLVQPSSHAGPPAPDDIPFLHTHTISNQTELNQILPRRKSLLRPPTIRRTRNSQTHLTPQTKLDLIIQPPELTLRKPRPVLPTPRVIRSHHLGYALYNQPSCRESPLRLGAE